jgi:zinc protease
MLEHMVFKGTDKRPKGQVAADVERTGGYLNAATSFDHTVYLTDMTREHWKTGLDVLRDMAFHPTLDPAELESEKDVVVAELKRGEDNPGQRLFRMTQQASLKGTPYADPVIGYEKTIRDLTSETMRDYITRLYQPRSMLLVICGDVDPDDALAEVARQFGGLENTRTELSPAHIAPGLEQRNFTATVEQGPWNKVHLSLSFLAPGMKNLRSSQLDVLAQILGGDASSRFYRAYKYEKRLVDSISVSNYSFERLGMLYIQVTLDADKLPAFWKAFSGDLAKLDEAVFSPEELRRARLNLEDEMFRSKETLAGQTSKLGYFAFFGDAEQGEANYLQTVKDTDQPVLTNLVREYFSPRNLSLAVLMPEGATPPAGGAAWDVWLTETLQANWPVMAKTADQNSEEGKAGQAERIDLGKGRTLVLIPDTTLPYTAVDLVFTGGDALLAATDQGLATFAAALLTKGTSRLSATEMEEYLSDRAASFSSSSGRQTFAVSMDAPERFTPDLFALLRETLTEPAMLEEEAERVRDNQIAAVTMREDQPTGLAFRRMFPFLFGNHPYGYLKLGEKNRVAGFTSQNAKDFWRKQVRQPWVLSVCGSFDRQAIIEAAKTLPEPGARAVSPAAPRWNNEKELDLSLPGRNQSHLLLVFPTVPYGAEDEPGLELLQNILAGQSGLLFRELRDKQGLGYTVTAFPWKSEKAGALIFYIGTDPDAMQQAEEGFRKIIGDLRTGLLPEEELERGKNQIEGDYYRDHQTLSSRSAESAVLAALQRPLDAARTLVEKARTVDAAAIRELARAYLSTEKAYIVKVRPE